MEKGNETEKTEMQPVRSRMDSTKRNITKNVSNVLQPILEQRTTKIKTTCHYCNKQIIVKPDISRKNKHRYCSKECQINGRKIPKEIRTCKRCGKQFEVERYRKVQYCSKECGAGNPAIKRICKNCGNEFKKDTYHVYELGYGLYCSLKCRIEHKTGENSARWMGGISFEPYCNKFTRALKQEIRNKHNNKCFICKQEDEIRQLSVHHCDYNKSQGCAGLKWSLIPLCTHDHTRTNHNRWYWFALLRDYWIYKYENFEMVIWEEYK